MKMHPFWFRCLRLTSVCVLLAYLTRWAATADPSVVEKPFSIEQRQGITWLCKPNGEPFFSLGVCCVNMGAEWVVSIDGSRPVRARLGAGVEAIVNQPAVRVANLSGVNGEMRNIAAMELPPKLFGKKRFKLGDTIALSSTFATHCGAYRVEWKGNFTLSR